MQSLVGCTGFVGSNLAAAHAFDGLYNSKNIGEAYGTEPELLLYAGMRAEKFLANSQPEQDRFLAEQAMENIAKIRPQRVVLISTIDVYPAPRGVDEDFSISAEDLQPYGRHRLELERFVERNFPQHLLLRLPGLFGINLKKNFIYDYIHFLPALLSRKKYDELAPLSALVRKNYAEQENGFYKCMAADGARAQLKREFSRLGFSALNFTDSRGVFQFYNLANLWRDISIALENKLARLNLATEPVRIDELYKYLTGGNFVNEIAAAPPCYDFRSKHAALFGGRNGYLYDKAGVLADIKKFAEENMP